MPLAIHLDVANRAVIVVIGVAAVITRVVVASIRRKGDRVIGIALIVTIRGVVGYGSIYGQIKQSQVGVIESQTDGRMRMQKQSTAAGG